MVPNRAKHSKYWCFGFVDCKKADFFVLKKMLIPRNTNHRLITSIRRKDGTMKSKAEIGRVDDSRVDM